MNQCNHRFKVLDHNRCQVSIKKVINRHPGMYKLICLRCKEVCDWIIIGDKLGCIRLNIKGIDKKIQHFIDIYNGKKDPKSYNLIKENA